MELNNNINTTAIGYLLNNNRLVKVIEILLVFLAAFVLIKILSPFVKDNLVLKQAAFWFVNILMLFLVWLGIKLRGQKWSHFGVTFRRTSLKESLRVFLLSLLVFILAVMGFILGSIIMANITGVPESSDISNYKYLQDNIYMLLLTLCGVYVVSSFGEEVIYRAFLINRIIELGLDNKAGKIVSVIISALIFGLVHYEWGVIGIVQTAFMGLVLGIFYLKLKKRLWILILAHAYMDTILMIQMYLSG